MRQVLWLVLLLSLMPATSFADKLSDDNERKLISLENQVSALEGKAFKLERKIKEIENKIFKGNFLVGKTTLIINHKLDISGAFVVKNMRYALSKFNASGRRTSRRYLWKSKGSVPKSKRLFMARVKPLKVRVTVWVSLRGSGFGVFTYMRNYKIKFSRYVTVTPLEKRTTVLTITLKDTGSTNMKKRFFFDFRVKTRG
jgi:hypothetical protein